MAGPGRGLGPLMRSYARMKVTLERAMGAIDVDLDVPAEKARVAQPTSARYASALSGNMNQSK